MKILVELTYVKAAANTAVECRIKSINGGGCYLYCAFEAKKTYL